MPATSRQLRRLGVALGSLLATLLAIELGARGVGFDFEQKSRARAAIPIYYRMPDLPSGPFFYRRPGPDRWLGPVLAPMLRRKGYPEVLLPHEAALEIRYDAEGFRNPDDLVDWQIAVVGDSFTELGHLPYEALFTTRLAERLGVGVKNLGASYTGTFTHVHYLSRYGASPSLRHAVLAFFEANDIADLAREARWMRAKPGAPRRDGEDGRPASREPQSSFLRAVVAAFQRGEGSERARGGDEVEDSADAEPARSPDWVFVADEREIPITLGLRPPEPGRLRGSRLALLDRALGDWARAAEALHAEPWLLYLPSKARALHERLRWTGEGGEPRGSGRPGPLPELVRGVALRHGIAFIDASDALMAETAAGRLSYSAVFDTHLNAAGSRVVGDLLARALTAADLEAARDGPR